MRVIIDGMNIILPIKIQNREMMTNLSRGAVAVARGRNMIVGDQREIAKYEGHSNQDIEFSIATITALGWRASIEVVATGIVRDEASPDRSVYCFVVN